MRRRQLREQLAGGTVPQELLGTNGWIQQASRLTKLQLQPRIQGLAEQSAIKQMGSWPEGSRTEQAQRLSTTAHLFQQAVQDIPGRGPVP